MSGSSRKEVLELCIKDYTEASWLEKGDQLDQFVKLTGYSRKYSIKLLNDGHKIVSAPDLRGRPPKYGIEALEALVTIWQAFGCICSKRFVPFIPTMLRSLERFGHLRVSDEVRALLLSVSISTADRLLEPAHRALDQGHSTTKPNRALRNQVALRTHNGWGNAVPGCLEVDLVAHCGGRVSGSYLYTLSFTDIITGWTEGFGLLDRRAETVLTGIKQVHSRLPFLLNALDTDNGGEFINELLVAYCAAEGIEFTRSRAYKKNDQAHIEERNGSVVRRLVGYDRFDGEQACAALNALYMAARLQFNYYQPCLRLASKEREGSHVTRRYDRAQTPLERLLESGCLSCEQAEEHRSLFDSLDPIHLLGEVNRLQDEFWTFAWNCSESLPNHRTPCKEASCAPPIASVEPTPLTVPKSCPRAKPPKKALTPVASPAPSRPGAPASQQSEKIVSTVSYKAPLGEVTACAPELSEPKAARNYRRTKKPAHVPVYSPHGLWFTEVWPEVDAMMHVNPYYSAPRLLAELQQRHPGRFHTRQLKSLQRCLSQWRQAHPQYATMYMPGAVRRVPSAEEQHPSIYRKNGFDRTWKDVKAEITRDPYQSVDSIFLALQHKYPGRFRSSQLGTFRSKIHDWRDENPNYQKPSIGALRNKCPLEPTTEKESDKEGLR